MLDYIQWGYKNEHKWSVHHNILGIHHMLNNLIPTIVTHVLDRSWVIDSTELLAQWTLNRVYLEKHAYLEVKVFFRWIRLVFMWLEKTTKDGIDLHF